MVADPAGAEPPAPAFVCTGGGAQAPSLRSLSLPFAVSFVEAGFHSYSGDRRVVKEIRLRRSPGGAASPDAACGGGRSGARASFARATASLSARRLPLRAPGTGRAGKLAPPERLRSRSLRPLSLGPCAISGTCVPARHPLSSLRRRGGTEGERLHFPPMEGKGFTRGISKSRLLPRKIRGASHGEV